MDRYTAVVFSSQRPTGERSADDGYPEIADRMEQLARQQPGFLGIESARGTDGFGITVSYWASDADAAAWKQVCEHLEAQRLGRDRWYDAYHLRVATVEREYAWSRPTTVLHLALPDDWEHARPSGEYTISTRGVTLAEEGFIHCSYAHQVEAVANRFYADLDRLLLLSIDTARLGVPVVVEPPFPGAPEAFPHIYGPIPLAAVVAVTESKRDTDEWRLGPR
jgi:uncharacterized protein (DUF952 family)/heme-degrading monooxygenase HmoA